MGGFCYASENTGLDIPVRGYRNSPRITDPGVGAGDSRGSSDLWRVEFVYMLNLEPVFNNALAKCEDVKL